MNEEEKRCRELLCNNGYTQYREYDGTDTEFLEFLEIEKCYKLFSLQETKERKLLCDKKAGPDFTLTGPFQISGKSIEELQFRNFFIARASDDPKRVRGFLQVKLPKELWEDGYTNVIGEEEQRWVNMYCSSGINSKQKNNWFPYLGLINLNKFVLRPDEHPKKLKELFSLWLRAWGMQRFQYGNANKNLLFQEKIATLIFLLHANLI